MCGYPPPRCSLLLLHLLDHELLVDVLAVALLLPLELLEALDDGLSLLDRFLLLLLLAECQGLRCLLLGLSVLVDELFVELHFYGPSLRWVHLTHSMKQAFDVLRQLRACGLPVHAWP